MKKLCIIALAIVLTLSFAACGRRNDDTTENSTLPTTVPTTESSVLPQMDPTSATNIPDSDVEGATADDNDGMEDIIDDMTGNNSNTTDSTAK
ncbi:MAG: hypothetical protein IKU57_01305 [Oscillospiraceae bacterium]|nr:hypothetical protein [Oscillospiraceae bacterium]